MGPQLIRTYSLFHQPAMSRFSDERNLIHPSLAGAAGVPEVSNGTFKLRLQTYNPFGNAAGNLFLADEIRTRQVFAADSDR